MHSFEHPHSFKHLRCMRLGWRMLLQASEAPLSAPPQRASSRCASQVAVTEHTLLASVKYMMFVFIHDIGPGAR